MGENTKLSLPPEQISADNAAMGAIRGFCGWHVAPIITEAIKMTALPGSKIIQLPTRQLLAVQELKNDNIQVASSKISFSKSGLVEFGGVFTSRLDGIELKIEHGYEWDEIPDLLGIYTQLRKRAATEAGLYRTQNAGPFSYSRYTYKGAPLVGVPLLETEKEVLTRYKLIWGANV